jgi:hypothetical protein
MTITITNMVQMTVISQYGIASALQLARFID